MTRPYVVRDILIWLESYKGRDVVKAMFALPFFPILPDKVRDQVKRAKYRLVGKEQAGKVFDEGILDFMNRR